MSMLFVLLDWTFRSGFSVVGLVESELERGEGLPILCVPPEGGDGDVTVEGGPLSFSSLTIGSTFH